MQLPLLWQQSLWSNLGLSVWLKGTLVVGGFVCSVFFLLKATCLKVVLGAFLKEQQVIEQQNHNIRCFQLYPQGTKSINSRQKERKPDKLWWQLIKGFMMSPTLMWDLLFLNYDMLTFTVKYLGSVAFKIKYIFQLVFDSTEFFTLLAYILAISWLWLILSSHTAL